MSLPVSEAGLFTRQYYIINVFTHFPHTLKLFLNIQEEKKLCTIFQTKLKKENQSLTE